MANAISMQDLEDAKTDVDHIAAVATSLAPTATDRLGHVKQTLAGAVGSIAAITDRGAWASGAAYLVKDMVWSAGTAYICVLGHTAGATFAGDSAKWRVYQGLLESEFDQFVAGLADLTSPLLGVGMVGGSSRIVADIAAVRAMPKTGLTKSVTTLGYTVAGKGAGTYRLDLSDTTSADNGVTVIVATDGGRWKLQHSGTIYATQAGAIEDGVTDDYIAINAAVRAGYAYQSTYTDATSLRSSFANIKPITVVVNGLLRYTQTLHVPAGVVLVSGRAYFDRAVSSGLFYDPVNLDTAAVSALNYKKQGDNTYTINDDITTLPTGPQFDAGDYITAANNAAINCTVITAPGVQLGVSLIGAAGMVTQGMCVGENTSGDTALARMPKVAVLQAAAWGAVHNQPRWLARVQGAVFFGANGGCKLNQPYIARNGSTDNNLSAPIYMSGYAKGGSVGVTMLDTSDIVVDSGVIEHWYTPCVFNNCKGPRIQSPHIEAYGGAIIHAFACVASNVTVDDYENIAVGTGAGASIFWIQDCISNNTVIAKGRSPTAGYRFVTGSNSAAVLTIDRISRAQLQYGSVGDSSLIESVRHIDYIKNDLPYILVNSSGDDTKWGIVTPVATIGAAAERLRMFGGKGRVQLQSNVTMSASVDLSRISYMQLSCGAYTLTIPVGVGFQIKSGQTEVHVASGIVNASAASAPFLVQAADSVFDLYITGAGTTVSSSYSLVLYSSGYSGKCNIIVNGATISSISKYINAAAGGYCVATLGVCTASRNTGIDATPNNGSVDNNGAFFRNS